MVSSEKISGEYLIRQYGQVLALGLFFLCLILGALVYFFQSTLLLQKKTHLVASVDAAAYSAALVQARALNMHAYLNRSQIAHQIAMGHLVTLASWAKFGDRQAKQLAQANPPVWTIASFFGAYGLAYAKANLSAGMDNQFVRHQVGQLSLAFMEHDRVVNDTLAHTQNMLFKDIKKVRNDLVDEVFLANQYSPGTLEWSWQEDGLSSFVIPKNHRQSPTIHNMVTRIKSYYDFLSPRNDKVSSLLPVDEKCPWLRHELRRQGETTLNSEGQWSSWDTLSWHALRSNRWIGCYYREYPMGYADVNSSGIRSTDNAPDNFSLEDFWRWASANTRWDIFGGDENPLARSWAAQQLTYWPSRGYVDYAGLRDPSTPLLITLYARHAKPLAQAQSNSLRKAAELAQGDSVARDLQTQHSSRAETYYREPLVYSLNKTSGSLFQPFWQARLIPLH